MPLELLPDPGDALAEFLRADPDVSAIFGDRVSVKLAGWEPAIRYAVVGGTIGWPEAQPRVQVECWGPPGADDGTASRGARTVVAALPRLGQQILADGWVITAIAEGHPYDAPDDVSDRARQIVTVRMLTHPA